MWFVPQSFPELPAGHIRRAAREILRSASESGRFYSLSGFWGKVAERHLACRSERDCELNPCLVQRRADSELFRNGSDFPCPPHADRSTCHATIVEKADSG